MNISQKEKISLFKEILTEYNQKMNLVSRNAIKELEKNHFKDSLAILDFVDFKNDSKIADLGSGGGLPAILLAIALPKCSFFLIDSTKKKCDFLKFVKQKLDLKNVTVLNDRIENISKMPDFKRNFDFVTAKALALLPKLVEYSYPLLKKNGLLFAYKGKNFKEEIDEASDVLLKYNMEIDDVFEYYLGEFGKRYLVKIQKTDTTNDWA